MINWVHIKTPLEPSVLFVLSVAFTVFAASLVILSPLYLNNAQQRILKVPRRFKMLPVEFQTKYHQLLADYVSFDCNLTKRNRNFNFSGEYSYYRY